MRRAKWIFTASRFMLDDKEATFNSRKERDAFHGAMMKIVVKDTKYKSKLPPYQQHQIKDLKKI